MTSSTSVENEASESDRIAPSGSEVSLFGVGTFLLRWRRLILSFVAIGAAFGLASALLGPRRYVSSATFMVPAAQGNMDGLRQAANRLGLAVPSVGESWGTAVYTELLRSSAVLERLARDTIVLAEESGRRTAVVDLLEVDAPTPGARVDRAIPALRGVISSRELPRLGAVEVSVATESPSASLALAVRLIESLNEFSKETRKSQAADERQFAATQAAAAERELRQLEQRLQTFLQNNRAIGGSPELTFEHDRLQREVALRQQLYTSLLQNYEEARLREVRDVPVVTFLEKPRLAVAPEPRNAFGKAFLAAFAGGVLAVLIAFVAQSLSGAKQGTSPDARVFFQLLREATPRFLRPRIQS